MVSIVLLSVGCVLEQSDEDSRLDDVVRLLLFVPVAEPFVHRFFRDRREGTHGGDGGGDNLECDE